MSDPLDYEMFILDYLEVREALWLYEQSETKLDEAVAAIDPDDKIDATLAATRLWLDFDFPSETTNLSKMRWDGARVIAVHATKKRVENALMQLAQSALVTFVLSIALLVMAPHMKEINVGEFLLLGLFFFGTGWTVVSAAELAQACFVTAAS